MSAGIKSLMWGPSQSLSTLGLRVPGSACGGSCRCGRFKIEYATGKGGEESNSVHRRMQRTALAFAFSVVLFVAAFASVVEASNNDSRVKCSRTCVAQNCNTVGIRYGKYCGVGWTGCPGEEPCDELDACCKAHDECVEKKGLIDIKCHEKFKRCIKKVHKSGKAGFSRDCPYDIAVPTMVQGMDMAILFSQLGSSKLEL